MSLYPEFTHQPDSRQGHDVYTFYAYELQWKLTVVRREKDSYSIISNAGSNQLGKWPSALDVRRFHGCLTPEAANEIIDLGFHQWKWGTNHGERQAKLKMQEALGL